MSDTWDSAPLAPAAPPAPTGSWDSAPLALPTPQQKAVVSANDNGDEAAKALAISKKTQIPATVVQSDIPGYDAHAKQQSAIKASENPYLAKYIDGNPMAAKVSGDDYDHLDEVSQTLQALHPELVKGKAQAGLFQGIPEIANMLGTAPGREKLYNAAKALPGAIGQGLLDFFETPGKVQSGEINLTTSEGLDKGISFGIGVALGGRDIQIGRARGLESVPGTSENNFLAGNETALKRVPVTGGTVDFDSFMHTVEGFKTRQEIDDFIASKSEGPPGAMLQIEHAKAGGEVLDAAVETAQGSKTKERSPELFAEAAEAHDPGNVHIDAGKIMELYQKEGKTPAEGDGLLGFVPDLAAKVQDAEAAGGEVTIPVSQYIAHIDPTVHEGLKDSVRLHDDGVTREESAELEKEVKAFDPETAQSEPPSEPVAKEKESLGLEPLFMGEKTEPFLNMVFKNGTDVGITTPEFKAYSDKIARAEQAILDKAVLVGRREAGRRLTPEWKRNEAAIRDEVEHEFRHSGAFAAEKYLRDNKIKLDPANADNLAPLFGFETGRDLLDGLTDIDADGRAPQIQLREAVAAETANRMEARYGNLVENIAKEAREAALADHTFDILADEVRILANASGITPLLSRQEMVDWAKASFERSNIKDAANWEKLRRAVERGGREAEKALLKGDFLEAFQAKQRQMLAATLAKQSLGLQKIIDNAENKIDQFSSEEVIPAIGQDHLEQLRQMLASVGVPQQFAPLANTPALRDFVDQSEGQIAIAPWLMDGSQPKLQDMSVEQFRDFVKSMQSLEHAGRDAIKLENAYGSALLQNVVGDAVKALERFPFIDQPANPSITQRAASFGRKILGAHLLVERVLDYTDKFDPHGPLTEWLDRPLRDANSKEITLTEQVVRQLNDLRQYTDASINNKIPNRLIPDALDKTGFASMTRQNLRVLMLNMGNWSNVKKVVEGFKINETDLRKFISDNASDKDVAWVNGIWKVFEGLKPEADAVQLRDTGVPVDHIPAVPWSVKGGDLAGGYYPLSYDPYNSDIQGRVASPLFDKGYFAATTPHGYTRERTGYTGAVDLSGMFLQSKIQGMVHDISFREAVRNANKLISNQEFRTAMAQYWGKEIADLMPGWLRDIANSHNLDDNYARGIVKAASLVRQNVTSTLIAYNPGTFIKHGFTAAVMSSDRVGGGALLRATGDLGIIGTLKNLKELVSKQDRIPDEDFMEAFRGLIQQNERGDNARQFILDSSAVMRNRQRQYEESIAGAVQAITNIGPAKTFADFRQRQMQYGRLAVAFSDQMSAMPTWLAAYKKAYLSGESHADAVFIADKEMSRAHGSSFIGDKPLVSRIGNSPSGEIARWFVSLYNFWNHQFNNNIQLAWDMKAALQRESPPSALPPPGAGPPDPEPGANAASISRRVAGIMAIIFIEEMASGAKDEDHHGLLAKTLLASLRYLGGGIVGLREITNGLAGGYEPSTGMIGTLFKAGSDTVKDIARATGAKAGVAKNAIVHTATTLGFLTGVGGSQLGRTGQFGADVARGVDRPQTFNDYRQGLRTGHSKARKH